MRAAMMRLSRSVSARTACSVTILSPWSSAASADAEAFPYYRRKRAAECISLFDHDFQRGAGALERSPGAVKRDTDAADASVKGGTPMLYRTFQLAALAATLLAAAPGAFADEALKVGKSVPQAFGFRPLNVGIEKGIFKKNGLEHRPLGREKGGRETIRPRLYDGVSQRSAAWSQIPRVASRNSTEGLSRLGIVWIIGFLDPAVLLEIQSIAVVDG